MEQRRGRPSRRSHGRDRPARSRSRNAGRSSLSPSRAVAGRGGPKKVGGGGGDVGNGVGEPSHTWSSNLETIDPLLQREINRLVRARVDREVARALATVRADVELKTERKIKEGLDVILRTVKSAMKHEPERRSVPAASTSAARAGVDRSARDTGAALAALRTRTEQIENHVESYLRRHEQLSEDLAQRVDSVERQLRDTPSRPAGSAVFALDVEEFDTRLASVEARIKEVCDSQEQDTMHLRRQIAQVEEHRQAMQILSDGTESERQSPPGAQQVARNDALRQSQREVGVSELEQEQRGCRKSLQRLEKRQAELESTMKQLRQNPAIAVTLRDRTGASASSIPPDSPTHDPGSSPRLSNSDGSEWDMVADGAGEGLVATPALRALELRVDEMRRDTDRCQELLKFCSTRLNLRSIRAIRVEAGDRRGARGDETTISPSQWKMALVPGVPLRRQVKSQRRWKTADWKPPHLVRAAKAAGVLDLHGSVAKARATKLYRDVAKARAAGAIAPHGPTLRDMFMEARAWGKQELENITLELHEAQEKAAAEAEVRGEMQATLRKTESQVEEVERTLTDLVEQSTESDKALRALQTGLDDLGGWRDQADDLQRQIEDVGDRCHQTASAVADHQLGMKALEALVAALPAQGAADAEVQTRPAPSRQFTPGADWLKDDGESDMDQRLQRFVAADSVAGNSTRQESRVLSPQKQRTSDHLSRLQKRMDEAIGSGDPSKVVAAIRDAAAIQADDNMSARPDHTFVSSLTALKNHAATLCDRGCEQMEALLGAAGHGPSDAVGSSDPGLIEDELARWEDLANWNTRVGAVWSRLADYHDALTGQVEELRRTLRILSGRARQPRELANLEVALSESVVFQPELATDRKRLEAVVQALAVEAETMLRDAKSIKQIPEIDDLLVTFERVTSTRVRAAWQALRAHRDDVEETCSQLRALIQKTIGCGDDGRVSAVIKEAEPYAGQLGQPWVAINQYHNSLRSEGTRELQVLLQVQPGEHGTDSEASSVIAQVDAALARYQHSTDPKVLAMWSELCVHRATLRDGISKPGGRATATRDDQLVVPPADKFASGAVERAGRGEHDIMGGTDTYLDALQQLEGAPQLQPNHDVLRQQPTVAQEQRLAERRRHWASESPQESSKSPLVQRATIPNSEQLLDSFRGSKADAQSHPHSQAGGRGRGRGRGRGHASSGGGGRQRLSVQDDGGWSDSDLSDSGMQSRPGYSSPGRPERRPPRAPKDDYGWLDAGASSRTAGSGVEADRARAARAQRGPPGR